MSLKNETPTIAQEVYDAFNTFIFSDDYKIFGKLMARAQLFRKVTSVPGDIVECGVFKGSGVLTWLKLKRCFTPNAFKKVIGFDFFNTKELLATLEGHDKKTMEELFKSRQTEHKSGYRAYLENLIQSAGFSNLDFQLIEGDIVETSKEYVQTKPGAKISLLYMDIDLGEPTYQTLKALWPRVSRGGIVVFDEYAYHEWSESQGVDKFAEEYDLVVKSLSYNAPTAYLIRQ